MVTDSHSILARWKNHLVTDSHSILARWKNHLVIDSHRILARWKKHLVTDSHSILARWKNHFSQLLTVHWFYDVRQKEIHTTEPLMSELSAFEVEMATEELKRCKSQGTDQIPAEVIRAVGRKLHSEIHKLFNSIWNEVQLTE